MARPPMNVDPREIYHSLCPLPFLSPVPKADAPETIASQRENEAAYRQLLVQGVLAILLPTEDLSNPCLTAVVGDILAETVIGNAIANKASQPWLLYEAFCILANKFGKGKRRRKGRNGSGEASHHRSGSQSNPRGQPGPARQSFSAQDLLFTALHWVFLAYSTIRILVTTLASASSFPRRVGRSGGASEKGYLTYPTAGGSGNTSSSFAGSSLAGNEPVKVPIAAFRIWPCMASMIELQDRMPWLSGALSMIQLGLLDGPGQIANLDGLVDRTLSHFICHSILDPALLPPLLRTLRAALFPNNAPGKPTLVPPADNEQLLALRRRSAASLASLVPPWVTSLYFCGRAPWRSAPPRQTDQDSQATTNTTNTNTNNISPSPSPPPSGAGGGVDEVEPEVVEALDDVLLDLFSDEYCNKHLMYSILDLVIVRLVPELAEKRVSDLWGERLS